METPVGSPMAYPIGETDIQTRRLITQSQLYDPFTRAFFEAAGIGRGMKVLELGSGVGDVTRILAELVGPSGRVVGVELKQAAVETAQARIAAAGWRNVEMLTGAIESVILDADFDAVAGRFVLMWLPDPAAVLQQVVGLLGPGGIVAFQDNDFTFQNLASAPLPLFDRALAWMQGTMQMGKSKAQNGPDFHMGLKLPRLYQQAGLPAPEMTLDAPLGTGAGWLGYQSIAETIAMLRPVMQARGVALPADLDPADLAVRLRAEVVAEQAVIVLPALIGAWSRKPTAPNKL